MGFFKDFNLLARLYYFRDLGFAKFTRKRLCQSLFFIKLLASPGWLLVMIWVNGK